MAPAADRARTQRRRRLIDRVADLRRAAGAAPSEPQAAEPAESGDAPAEADELRALRARLDALEAAFEGLQDSVDRENRRQDAEIAELKRRLSPAEIARSLSDDARRRGL